MFSRQAREWVAPVVRGFDIFLLATPGFKISRLLLKRQARARGEH